MKKGIAGVFLLLVALALLVAGFRAGGNAVAGGVVLAVVFVSLALRMFGILKRKKKKQIPPKAAQTKDPGVWVANGGETYHQNDICQYLYGKKSKLISRSDAVAQGLRPCKKCYPYGN